MIGGMSWESTAEYYRLANRLVADRLGGLHSADLVLRSLDFEVVAALQRRGAWSEAAAALAQAAVDLEGAGAELLVLCTNTMHKVVAEVESAVTVPVLHVVDVTAAAVRAADLPTVGLLGTAFTMEQDFYHDRLASHGIEVIVPGEADRREVHRVIFEELCRGTMSDGSRVRYREVMARLVEAGAQGVVLGCTEIELLVGQDDCAAPVFPTTRLHVQAAVDAALG